MRNKFIIAAVAMAFAVPAQARLMGDNPSESYSRSGSAYARGETLSGGDVVEGTVLQVREVKMEASATARTTGTVAGAGIGGAVGAALPKNKAAKVVGGIVGGVAGGAAGQTIGEAVSEEIVVELIIKLDSGKKIFVVQKDDTGIQPQDRVFILKAGRTLRVARNAEGL